MDPVGPAEDLRPPGRRLERQRALDRRHCHPLAGQRVQERDVRERIGEQRRLAELLGERQGPARMDLRRGHGVDRVRAPRQPLLDLDPQRDVDVRLGQRRGERLGRGPEPFAVRPHPPEPRERVRPVGGRVERRFEQRLRPRGIPRLEVALGGLDVAPPGRPELPRLLEQRRRRVRRAPLASAASGIVERKRHVLVRPVRGKREMPRPLLGIIHERREPRVRARACPRRARRRASRAAGG